MHSFFLNEIFNITSNATFTFVWFLAIRSKKNPDALGDLKIHTKEWTMFWLDERNGPLNVPLLSYFLSDSPTAASAH